MPAFLEYTARYAIPTISLAGAVVSIVSLLVASKKNRYKNMLRVLVGTICVFSLVTTALFVKNQELMDPLLSRELRIKHVSKMAADYLASHEKPDEFDSVGDNLGRAQGILLLLEPYKDLFPGQYSTLSQTFKTAILRIDQAKFYDQHGMALKLAERAHALLVTLIPKYERTESDHAQ